ncbi:cobalamin biosynthesis Mg chelatase CobN [Runella defluvii]|uniref:Cobalamin biosynthesis Mg chelatase CobN n=1 Tax=Runella defluvii TaxID=370973 RepID=A0A7W6ESS0_9BACT|nr:hypothetical protein [Runella defluvii]MBB3840751.1 cobalamin biosynthesis Mg chelatase CobN [Runella defluvii]
MTLEAALKQQGIDPNSISPTTKAQLENVLLQKGQEILLIVIQILINSSKKPLTTRQDEATAMAAIQAAEVEAEAKADSEAKKKKRNVFIIVGISLVVVAGVVVYIVRNR